MTKRPPLKAAADEIIGPIDEDGLVAYIANLGYIFT
jgi:hypothetical protein